jgi:predicted dehydrogenase
MFDFVNFLLASDPVRVMARGGRFTYGDGIETLDSAAVVVAYADGSVASITTGDLGHKDYPQERLGIFTKAGVIDLVDFVRLDAHGFGLESMVLPAQEKGLRAELASMVRLMEGAETELADARAGLAATATAVAATRSVATGEAQAVEL